MKFIEALGLAFIVLRLCGVIDWNWIWVLAPLWGSVLLNAIVKAVKKK